MSASSASGAAKAQSFLAAYAKHVGAHDAIHQTFDKDNDRSYGDASFRYFADKDVLQGRVFHANSDVKEWPARAHFERQVIAGLNDPKIGGMYDRGGGYFVLDEEKQMYFLVKDYPLATTKVDQFIHDFDNLNDLSAIWLTTWGPHAARQSYGVEPPPTQRIDREHNPYSLRDTYVVPKCLNFPTLISKLLVDTRITRDETIAKVEHPVYGRWFAA